MEGKVFPEKRHYWLLSYSFVGGSGFIYVDTKEKFISPASINFILKETLKEREHVPSSVSYLGFMTKEQASKYV